MKALTPAIPTVRPLPEHSRYRALAAQRAQCSAAEAGAVARMREIEALLAAPPRAEDPEAVLRDERPTDVAGLRREHEELRAKIERLQRAGMEFTRRMDGLADALTADVAAPVVTAHAELAREAVAAWREIAALAARERALLDVLPRAGFASAGLQPVVVPGYVDLETILREIERDAHGLAARTAPHQAAA